MGADNQAEAVIHRQMVRAWFAHYKCDHAHCPRMCQNPDPFFNGAGQFICNKCYLRRWGPDEIKAMRPRISVMVPCDGELCGGTAAQIAAQVTAAVLGGQGQNYSE